MSILPIFLPFLATVLSYLPIEHRSRRQLICCLNITTWLVMRITMPYSTKRVQDKMLCIVLRRVMSRVLHLFGDDEILGVLMRLNKSGPHNIRALRSVLCGTLPPRVQLCLSFEFVAFMNQSTFVERWLYVFTHFPLLHKPNARCTGFSLVVNELRTLYQDNNLFHTLLGCPSRRLRMQIFYRASRRQTKSFRALMNSFKRMKKALRGKLNLSSLNMYELTDCVLLYFFKEMQNMGRAELERLYESFAEGSLQLNQYYRVTPDGEFAPYPLLPMQISHFGYSVEDSKRLLLLCNTAFSFSEVPVRLCHDLMITATEPVSVDYLSKLTQGMYFVLSMIWFHQSMDPFLGYIIRTWLLHSHHDSLYDFHLQKILHVTLEDGGSTPTIAKLWKWLVPQFSDPPFLSIYRNLRLSDMLEMFYDIIDDPECFVQIERFISENSSANLQSLRLFLSTMEETSLEKRFRSMFHSSLRC